VGVDIEPYWVEESCRNAAVAGLTERVRFVVEDALNTDVSQATVVFLYLVDWSTQMIVPVIARQVAPGARLVSLSFGLGDWPDVRVVAFTDAAGQQRRLHLWVKEGLRDPAANA
jgi:hypothetical protein